MDLPATAASPSRRKPLQPKNFNPTSVPPLRPKPKLIAIRIPRPIGASAGKENGPIFSPEPETEPKPKPELDVRVVEPREASLGEELEAIRKSRERVREERERIEKELREKDAVMQRWTVELEKWAEEQRNLELELRLLIKLQDLRSSSMMSSPVRSLREEEEQKSTEVRLQTSSPSLREKERQKSMEVQLQVPESAEEGSEVDEASSIQEIETEKCRRE